MSLVSYDGEPVGLADVLGRLIAANLKRDPSRARLLRPATVVIATPDAEMTVTLRIAQGSVAIATGTPVNPDLTVVADSRLLLGLSTMPLRFGLPDVFRAGGREVLGALLHRRLRVRGLLRHPRKLARLNLLLSAN